jgi:hypothetical protein
MWLPPLLPHGHICEVTEELNKGVEIQLFGTHLESNPFERKKGFTRIQEFFAKIINPEVSSEFGLFYGGDDSLEVHDSRTKATATQLIKHAGSPNEV